ncbi:suppressor of fused domain protein [Kitasatospora viridis]
MEKFFAHLERVTAEAEPRFLPTPSSRPGLPGVTSVVYRGLPEPGMLTAVTYGLSLAEHAAWRHGRPELCLSVSSPDEGWAHALGFVAERMRGVCPFSYGDVVDLGERICGESPMTAFVVFAPAVLAKEDCLRIDVSAPGHTGPDLVNVQGVYPIHEVERQYVAERGFGALWQHEWDPYDVQRPPVV